MQPRAHSGHILVQLGSWHTLGALTSLAERTQVPRRVIAIFTKALNEGKENGILWE